MKESLKISEVTRKKMSEAHLRNPTRYWLGKTLTKKHIEKLRRAKLGRKLSEKTKKRMHEVYDKILQEIPPLEKQGFRCIPIGKVIPDIIAIKGSKVIAVEVEYGKPRYNKYTEEIKKYYNEIRWIKKGR